MRTTLLRQLVAGICITCLIAFCLTVSAAAQTRDLTVAVLVNSANSGGFNTSSSSPGEFQRYPERYLEHLQVPYRLIDVASAPLEDLSNVQLIVAGHRGLSLSTAWQQAILNAVAAGTGFVNLDWDINIGSTSHMIAFFGATGSGPGTAATSIRVPASVLPGGGAAHYITAMQLTVPSDPAGDLVYQFHESESGVVGTATATLLQGGRGTVLAYLGNDPLLTVTTYGAGRVVNFGTYDYLKADRFGFMMGVDDLFWRSLVWAARKPFVLRGYPRFFAVQMDDPVADWGFRVGDLFNPAFTGTQVADGTGGPWKVTGMIQEVNLYPGSAERAQVISYINSGQLKVALHTNTGGSGGDLYWTGETPNQLTDSQWLSNLNNALTWQQGNGSSDYLSFSKSMVPHFWDLSNNTGYDLWNSLGVRYLTTIQKPGVYYSQSPAKTDDERLWLRPFRIYELPPTYGNPAEQWPIYYADDITVGSRQGLPAQTFFSFCTQLLGTKYPRFDAAYPNDSAGITVAQSVENFEAYAWRFWSSMAPVQVYSHDGGSYANSTVAERQSAIQQISAWLAAHGVRHVFMEEEGAYMRARNKSKLATAQATPSTITLNLTGSALDADGKLITTKSIVYYTDNEGQYVDIPGFTNGTTNSFPNAAAPTLALDKTLLTFSAVPGGSNPASQSVTVMNTGTGTINWSVSSNAAWLTATPASGTNNGTLTVSANISGLSAGTYNGTITVQAPGASNSPQTISVTLTLAGPSLSVNPSNLGFTAFQGQANPAPATLSITNTGGGTLNWTASSNAGWLSVSPTSGSAPASPTVSVNIAGLAVGTYTGQITITAAGATNSPATVPVTLTISATSGVLMYSSFNDGSLNGWLASPLGLLQNWSVTNGVVQYNGGGHTQLYAGDSSWSNYDVQAKIKLATLNNYPGGIRGRVNPSTGAAYALWLYPGSGVVRLYRVTSWNIDAGYTLLDEASVAFDTSAFHTFKLSFAGSSIGVSYDDKLLFTVVDNVLSSGMVALDVSNQVINFDDVTVTGTSTPSSSTVTPTSLTFNALLGQGSPAAQTIQLGSTGGALTWSVVDDANWLTVTPGSGLTPATLTASVNATGLAAGIYSAHISVVAPGSANPSISVPVTFNLTGTASQLVVSPSTVSFTALSGQPLPAGQVISIANAGTGTLNWTSTSDSAWLIPSTGAGSTPSQLTLSLSTDNLALGTYTGHLTVQAPGASNSPVVLPVTLQFFSQLMNEDFANGAGNWTLSPMGGAETWTSVPGSYSHTGTLASQSCAGSSGWMDYQFQTKLQLASLSNFPGGVRGRVNPTTGAGYGLWLYPADGLVRLFRIPQWNIDGGGTTQLAQAPISFDTNPHTLRLDFQGSNITAYWDDTVLMQATDSTYGNGYVCLDGSTQPVTSQKVVVLGTSNNSALASLTTTPASLSFTMVQGDANPSAQTLALGSSGTALDWTASSTASWLSVSAASGTTPSNLTVSADGSGLAAGTYSGAIALKAAQAANPSVSVPVTFTVTAPLAITGVSLSPQSVIGGTAATGTVTLSSVAPAGGTTVTLTSDNGSAVVPNSVLVPAGSATGTFTVSTTAVATNTAASITASYGSSSASATLTVTPVPLPTVQAISLNPNSLIGGATSTGTVTLSAAAPAGGATVALTSNSGSATVPSTVIVPAGSTTATFTLSTAAVASSTTASITGTYNSSSRSASLTITPPAVQSLTLNSTSVVGGATSVATVTLNGAAPVGGASILVSSSHAAVAQVPTGGTVTVPAGATSVTFTVNTTPVTANTAATISAAYGSTASASLTVNAPQAKSVTLSPSTVVGGNNSTGTVTLTGPAPAGGVVIALSSANGALAQVPATVIVSAGATTATFSIATKNLTTTTRVTISATYGAKVSATLTLNVLKISSITLNPASVVGGTPSTGTATLNGPATSDTVVSLSSGNTARATVPATVTVPAGSTSATFTVTTFAVTSATTVRITGRYNGTSVYATLSLAVR